MDLDVQGLFGPARTNNGDLIVPWGKAANFEAALGIGGRRDFCAHDDDGHLVQLSSGGELQDLTFEGDRKLHGFRRLLGHGAVDGLGV